MERPFYVTTPIYYVNDRPHIGHAYSTVAADVISRYQRLRGRSAYFMTGLDEHGLKIERRAKEEGLAPRDFVDQMAAPFRLAWEELECAHDGFIRTTSAQHRQNVQALWKLMQANGDIYLDDYEDWYCVGCESFKTEKELLEGNLCPIHQKPVERIKERSYFFRLSKYAQPLLDYYESHPSFVQPEARFNEVKSFVKEGLRDLSISRTSFRWGVPVPDDPEHVVYVWLDALMNYVSALGGPAEEGEAPLYDEFWRSADTIIHIVGKDILRFHAIYWPAFLLSAGIRLPTQVWAHGWLTVNGEKMSKSLGNFLPPGPLVEAFGADVLRYYFMREVGFGQDGDFSHRNLLNRYNGELANGLGNLMNRIVASILAKSLQSRVPRVDLDDVDETDRALIETAQASAREAARHFEALAFHRALDTIWELVSAANKYVDTTQPWKLAKQDDKTRLEQVCYTVLETLRWLSIMLFPVMPSKCNELRAQLGMHSLLPTEKLDLWPSSWGGLRAGTETRPAKPLFPRFDEAQEHSILERLGVETPTTAKKKATAMTKPERQIDLIEFDDFAKVDLRVAQVKEAERVPKSHKLVRLMVDAGEESPRQIVAGISEHYAPEDLVGKRIVIVANLKPRKLMGLESQGMVLAASDESGLSLLGVDKEVPPGSRAK
ncbi:MAG: methionine--tRNA ligase [Myxococcales bacterium]|jgi:methionyl-tRNA synthetase